MGPASRSTIMLPAAAAIHPHSDLQFRGLLDKLPAAAYMCDAQGLITYFNDYAAKLWGRTPKLNDPLDRFCGSFKLFGKDGSAVAHTACWMALALQTGREYNGEEIVVERPDGNRLTVLAHANPIHDQTGELIGALNVLVDITDRIAAEKVLRGTRDELARMVGERTAQLTELSRHLLQVAEDERARLAAEVHDDLGSTLTLLSLRLSDMGKHLSQAPLVLQLEHREIMGLLHDLIDGQRRVVGSLRPILLDYLGLALAIRNHVDDWAKRTGLEVRIDVPAALPDLPPPLALALFRILQESLTNIAKHSAASCVHVTLAVDRAAIRLSVEDNGKGVSESTFQDPDSHGMIGMRERIARFGGSLTVGPGATGRGALVAALAPLDAGLLPADH